MHNLEELIAEWRKSIRSAQVGDETIDELEDHLREQVGQLVQTGMTEADAFKRAIADFGTASGVALEFRKLGAWDWWPARLVVGLEVAVTVVMALFVGTRIGGKTSNYLLASHVFAVTLGYATTVLIGLPGVCFVAQRCVAGFSPMRAQSLTRVTLLLGRAAVFLTALAILLGMSWSEMEWHRLWSWDSRELGALLILAWQICFLWAHRTFEVRRIYLMSLLGNIVVVVGWFGVNLLGATHAYFAPGASLFLFAPVVLSILFFLIGLAPAGWLRTLSL